jgi:hypothetical protein
LLHLLSLQSTSSSSSSLLLLLQRPETTDVGGRDDNGASRRAARSRIFFHGTCTVSQVAAISFVLLFLEAFCDISRRQAE